MPEVLLPAREELVAGGAEPLPHGLLVAPADRPDRLPLSLKSLNFRGGFHPVGGIGKCFGALAERNLGGKVSGALFVLRGQMRGGSREHLVLRRLETAPHRLALRARRERHLFPSRLQ